jgi:SAM-dependent methyltransferase
VDDGGRARPSRLFDRIADRYDETRGGLLRGRRFAEAINEHLPRGAAVLEVGVGTGAVALPLTELGHDVLGIDLGPGMLAHAHERLGHRVALADAHEIPVRDAAVDAIVTVWVLHAVGDPARVVRELYRVVRPGGVWCAIAADADVEPNDVTTIEHDLRVALGRFVDAPGPTRSWAAAAGFVEAAAGHVEPFEHDQTPEEAARDIEARTTSALWDLDSSTWARVVQPRIDALRGLPEPDRPRRCVRAHPIVVFRRPPPGA